MTIKFKAMHVSQLQNAYRANKTTINYRTTDNIFYQLCQAEPTLGVIGKNTIELSPLAWPKIIRLVEQTTQINLATHDISELQAKNRIENTAITSDEKLLSTAPTKGFIQVRLIAKNQDDNAGCFADTTPIDCYIGLTLDKLVTVNIDNLIIIENFTPFVRMTEQNLACIEGLNKGPTLLVYRGHDSQTVYANLDSLKKLNCKKYIFTDYDFAGLNLAVDLSKKIVADGVILPSLTISKAELKKLSKFDARLVQTATNTDKMTTHYQRLKDEFLAITQESLLYHCLDLRIFN
jgi:hypothetical protein